MTSFKDKYSGKKVLIFGLGLNDGGVGMAEFFVRQGAEVTVTDGKTAEELETSLKKLSKYKGIKYRLGEHVKKDFLENDIIIRNPAIKPGNKWLEIAKKAGKQIEMEMSLFHKLAPCPIVGITGTKGKSTTTTLIYLFLKQKYGKKVLLAGNIGKSAIRELPNLKEDNIVVLELSSYQLDAMGRSSVSPDVAVITNIFQDHINWHGSMEEYIDAKMNIFRYQRSKDVAIVNIDDDRITKFVDDDDINANLITYSLKDSQADFFMDDVGMLFERDEVLTVVDRIPLQGRHNRYNISAAVAAARSLEIKRDDIENVLWDFKGVEFRQQFIREIKGIRFINDTTATTTEAVVAALNYFGKKYSGNIIMISGGVDKDLDYGVITDLMEKHLKALVLLNGSASEKINDALGKTDLDTYAFFNDFKKAVHQAYDIAESGDLVILCPGAASFNMFANEFDRGRQFNEIVDAIE